MRYIFYTISPSAIVSDLNKLTLFHAMLVKLATERTEAQYTIGCGLANEWNCPTREMSVCVYLCASLLAFMMSNKDGMMFGESFEYPLSYAMLYTSLKKHILE